MKKFFISVILIVCLLFSVSSVYASTDMVSAGFYESEKQYFAIEGQEYYIVINNRNAYNEGYLFDVNGKMIDHVRYPKIQPDATMNFGGVKVETLKNGQLVVNASTDAEGYTKHGSYTYNLGYISSAASLTLAITTAIAGIPVSVAIGLVGDISSFAAGNFEVTTDVWRKTDAKYEYVKRYVRLYETVSGKRTKVAGPRQYLQKKALDA